MPGLQTGMLGDGRVGQLLRQGLCGDAEQHGGKKQPGQLVIACSGLSLGVVFS